MLGENARDSAKTLAVFAKIINIFERQGIFAKIICRRCSRKRNFMKFVFCTLNVRIHGCKSCIEMCSSSNPFFLPYDFLQYTLKFVLMLCELILQYPQYCDLYEM